MNRVYSKTPAGEQAVQERTRLVQRNLRNVLIVVDGRSTVSELCEKVGKLRNIESALEQLERDGYIEVATGGGGLWEKGRHVAGEIREAAADRLADLRGKSSPESAERPKPPDALPPSVPSSPFAVLPPSPFETGGTVAPGGGSPGAAGAPGVANPFARTATPLKAEAGKGSMAVGRAAPAPGEDGGGILRQLKARWRSRQANAAQGRDDDGEKVVVIRHPRHGRRGARGLVRQIGIALVAVVVIGILGVVFFPYGIYQRDIEAGLERAIGLPVRLGNVRAGLASGPALILERVSIGEGELGASLAEVRVVPTVASFFGASRRFGSAAIVGARIPVGQLAALLPAIPRLTGGEAFSVSSLRLENVELQLQDWKAGPLSGEWMPGDGSRRPLLALRSVDGSLQLAIAAEGEASIELGGWKPVADSPFVWDALRLEGKLSAASFAAGRLEGRLADGSVQGQMRIDWGAGGVNAAADFALERASGKRLGDSLGSGVALEGELSGRARLSARAERIGALRDQARLEGSFVLRRGAIEGIDLVEAIRRGASSSTRGGATRFDQLSGSWAWTGQVLRLGAIDVSSGALQASGAATVGAGQQLSGSFDVRLKSSATAIRMPVALSGTLKNPLLQGGTR